MKLLASCPKEIAPQKCERSPPPDRETELRSLYQTEKTKFQLKPAGGFESERISVSDHSVEKHKDNLGYSKIGLG